MSRNQRRLNKGQNKSLIMLEEANRLQQMGSFIEAERLYRRILAENPNNADALHLFGVLHLQLNKPQQAVDLINRAIQLNQNIAFYHSNLAIALQSLGKFDEAVQQFKTAIYLKPDYFEGYNAIGHIFNDKGDHAEAIKNYEQAIAINPNYFEAVNNIGAVLQDLGRFDQAIEYYKRALNINPNYIEAHNNLGSALQEKGAFEESKKSYQQVLALNPNHPVVYYNLAQSCLKIGDNEEAAKYLARYLELDREDLYGATLLLANLGKETMPGRASDAQLQRLYTKRAQSWRNISDKIYKAPQLVANALLGFNITNKIDVLDAGCGTGLVGVLVKHIANKLDGIDISLPMLEQANSTQVYNTLHQGDLVSFMANNPDSYDAITCSATLIHFGDLNPALNAAALALRPKGLFICTLFPSNDGKEISAANGSLMQSGCYAHSKTYIEKVAEKNNFTIELLQTDIHEYHKEQPVECLLVALRRNKF